MALQTELAANNQYHRQNNLLISGIPEEVEDDCLEKIPIDIINKCNGAIVVAASEIQGCHRLSRTNKDVICRVTNKRYVETTLENRSKVRNLGENEKSALDLPASTGIIYLNEHPLIKLKFLFM